MRSALKEELRVSGDPRMDGGGDVFETFPRYSSIRVFPQPTWAREAPDSVPDQPWLQERLGPAFR